MKNTLLILSLIISFIGYSQKTPKVDSTEICFPYQVGQQILLDLNDCDETKRLFEISKKETKLLNQKVVEQEGIIGDLKEQVVISDSIIARNEDKFKVVDEENKNLRGDITKLKLKNTIFNIVGGAIIGGLTYIIIFK